MPSYLVLLAIGNKAFHIVITIKDNHLFAQVTGQSQFELFASDHNKFYLKLVDAKVEFNINIKGKEARLALFQNGQKV